MNQVATLFSKTKIDYLWSFSDKTRKDTAYITHGYHRYPAKFIPQIVSRLAEKYTKERIGCFPESLYYKRGAD